MKIIDNTAIRLSLPSEHARLVLDNVERSELVADLGAIKDVLIYWGYKEASILAEITNKTLPSPIIRDYSWPGLYTPFEHQKTTASFLSLYRRAFCFNEAGTGKTSSVIWAADYLMQMKLVKRVLIVCPLSIMYSAWQADVFNTAMHRTVGVAYGDKNRRAKVISSDYEFIIINYDGIGVVHEEILNARFDLIVIDEANAYKTPSTKRWKAMAKLLVPSTRLWMLTGTPASQSPVDAFGLAKMVSPSRVPKFAMAWKSKVMHQVSRFKWIPKPSAKHDVFNALQPAIRYTKAECLDLPDVMHLTRDVPLTVQAASYYKKLLDQMLIEPAGEQISAVNAAAKLNKLLQISGGAAYTDNGDVVIFDVSPRLQALKEALDETENKVVVFVPFLHTIDLVTDYLTKEGFTHSVIRGDVSARERGEITKRFQSLQDPRILVVQPQSASHGLTFTAADTVVFWSPVMSVETYLQCIARIDRIGQKNKMTVVHLQGSAVERQMYAMLRGKVDIHKSVVDLYKQVVHL